MVLASGPAAAACRSHPRSGTLAGNVASCSRVFLPAPEAFSAARALSQVVHLELYDLVNGSGKVIWVVE